MSNDRPPLLARLWHGSLLVFGSVLCIWLAVQLLSQIWVIVVLVVVALALVIGVVWWLRNRW